MNERLLLLIVLGVSALTLLGLLAIALFIRRMYYAQVRKQDFNLSGLAEAQDRLMDVMHPLVESDPPLESVITRLSFAESFDPERFALASQECALSYINNTLASRSADAVVVTVNSLHLMPSGVEMTVSASCRGATLFAEGTAKFARHTASGRELPILKDVGTGRTIEFMKGVPAAKTLRRLGALSSAVVGAAHIIAGADIARQLKQVDSKINLLLAYRRMDQMGKLERMYTSAKELGSGPMTKEKRWELWRLRGELREQRCNWRRELQHHLNLIDDPNSAPWITRMFTRQRTSARQIHEQITDGQLHLALIEYSLRLDQVLAVGSQTIREFEETLTGELIELESVADMLKSKASLISSKYPDLSVQSTMDGMVAIVRQYRQLLPEGPYAFHDAVLAQGNDGPVDEGGAV